MSEPRYTTRPFPDAQAEQNAKDTRRAVRDKMLVAIEAKQIAVKSLDAAQEENRKASFSCSRSEGLPERDAMALIAAVLAKDALRLQRHYPLDDEMFAFMGWMVDGELTPEAIAEARALLVQFPHLDPRTMPR